MPFFSEDKRKKLLEAQRKAEAERKKELMRIINRPSLGVPTGSRPKTRPADYISFLRDVKKKPRGLYERAADFCGKILAVKLSKETEERINEDIRAAYLEATPSSVFSLAFFSFLLTLLLTAGVFVYGTIAASTEAQTGSPFFFALVIFFLGSLVSYLLYTYPSYQSRAVVNKMSSDSVLAVLYMIIYMRTSPNLEGGLRFASENLSGPLSWDLKKLLWDTEIGTYNSADEALGSYIEKWKNKNPEFSESLNLLRASAVSPERRDKLYAETINLILEGTRERTKHYVAGLRLPVLLIHAMGVLLPVMGLILFPIILVFMSKEFHPIFLFLGYDLILPLILWFLIDYILRARPATFSPPDISLAKGIPPLGKFSLGGTEIPILPVALILVLLTSGFGTYLLYGGSTNITEEAKVNLSLLITAGLGLGIFAYAYLDSSQKMKIREDISRIEDEFSVALFQLGNLISNGEPVESAVGKVSFNLRGMKISEMFSTASGNMKRFGYTFEDSLFDKKIGAVWLYPSKLIRSILSTIVESAKKGMVAVSDAMMTVSRYLKGIHDVREDTAEILGETISSMRFLGMFLTPLIAGVTVTMAVVIIQILGQFGPLLQNLERGGQSLNAPGQVFLTGPILLGGKMPIGPGEFQLIVGLYMLETVLILSYFVNKIEYGDDPIGFRANLASSVLMAVFIYIASWFVTYALFGSPIRDLLLPIQG